MELIWIRHGETALNKNGIYQGRTVDPPLNARGREQARLLAEKLGSPLTKKPRLQAFVSPMLRARQTAAPLLSALGLEPTHHDWLQELDYGRWEGLTVPEIEAKFPGEYPLWQKRPEKMSFEGGESLASFRKRLRTGLAGVLKAHKPGDTLLFVSHSGVIRMMVMDAIGAGLGSFRQIHIPHTGVLVLKPGSRGWVLQSLGKAHLE